MSTCKGKKLIALAACLLAAASGLSWRVPATARAAVSCASPAFRHAPGVAGDFVSHRAVTFGDFDGDGRTDVAGVGPTAGVVGGVVRLYLGDGSGGFGPPSDFPTGDRGGAAGITSGDFNRDGRLDLAAANNFGNSVSVLLNNGGGGFAPGEAQKTFAVPLVDDAHAEGTESFAVFLSQPEGGEAGAPARATVSVADNEAGSPVPNPLDNHRFFVRQHYLDFLSREPESGEPWTAVLTNCPEPFNTNPASLSAFCDHNVVSSSFFRSPEFQLKGFYVYRFYTLAFGWLPLYREIISDMRSVTGQTAEEAYRKRAAFAERWMQREGMWQIALVGGGNRVFVHSMMSRSHNLGRITTPDPADPEGARKVTLTADELADRLDSGALTHGQVVRAIADSDEVGRAEFNRAFVAMQYYGYLRRDPEESGLNNWLDYLNRNPTDFRTMVDGFMNSREYRLRFGQP